MDKEGKATGTYAAYGTYKATAVGKDRVLETFDENGLALTDGFADHTTWHCWGIGDYTNGMGQDQGYCVVTDQAGDQFVSNFITEKRGIDQPSYSGSDTWTGGTGKYAGISGGGTSVFHSGEFRPTTDGTYFNYATWQGNYKLP